MKLVLPLTDLEQRCVRACKTKVWLGPAAVRDRLPRGFARHLRPDATYKALERMAAAGFLLRAPRLLGLRPLYQRRPAWIIRTVLRVLRFREGRVDAIWSDGGTVHIEAGDGILTRLLCNSEPWTIVHTIQRRPLREITCKECLAVRRRRHKADMEALTGGPWGTLARTGRWGKRA